MTTILEGIGKAFLILVGYVAACLVASATLLILFVAWLALPSDGSGTLHGPLIFGAPVLAFFVAYLAFIPSAILILVSEFLAKRDWLFYALGGAAVSVVMIGYIWRETGYPAVAPGDGDFLGSGLEPLPLVAEPAVAATLIAAGICGGIAYWLVAGRMAGGWRSQGNVAPRP